MRAGPLLGTGLLAIWNGIKAGHDAEFLRWHVGEHIPERLSVPGFRRARRYRAVDGHPAYFNFYEVDTPEILDSAPYIARLNAPSDWTRSVVPHFTDVSRTLCRVVASHGHGVAGFVWAIRLDGAAETAAPLLDQLLASPDVSAAHLLERVKKPASDTQESAMRGAPDQSSRAILLVEGASPDALTVAVQESCSERALAEVTGAPPTHRGLYQLDFLMDNARQA